MANYQIEFLPTAHKELASLSKQVQQRITAKLELLKINPSSWCESA
jgi:mRNA-degrading endonuclease RelE of RelBE toxin-antitoxin system